MSHPRCVYINKGVYVSFYALYRKNMKRMRLPLLGLYMLTLKLSVKGIVFVIMYI